MTFRRNALSGHWCACNYENVKDLFQNASATTITTQMTIKPDDAKIDDNAKFKSVFGIFQCYRKFEAVKYRHFTLDDCDLMIKEEKDK